MSDQNPSRKRAFQLSVSLCVLMTAVPAVALAQSQSSASSSAAPVAKAPATPAPASAPKTAAKTDTQPAADDDDTTTVTVTAPKPILEHKIDRDIYDVKQDPMSATGAAADVLNNVPGVTVDNDGTVALRGNTGVQVLVNGKKTSQMQGDNRAFTLQSLAADDIDTIEVMPNPGAAYGADSAGGIINIVMKRGRSLRPITSINATAGDEGRGGIGLRTGKTFGKLKLNGSLTLNHGAGGNGRGGGGQASGGASPKVKSLNDRVELDPTTGAVIREDDTNNVSKSSNNNLSSTLSAEYDIDDSTDLTGEATYSNRRSTSQSTQETLSYDGNHAFISDIARLNASKSASENLDYHLTFDHRGPPGSTEDFKMQLSHSGTLNHGLTDTRNIFHQPAQADSFTTRASKSKDFVDEFSGDWSHPLGDYDKTQQQIQLGWSIQHTIADQYRYQSLTLPAPVAPPASPRDQSTTQFNDDEMLSAAYVTYQRQLGPIGMQAGLRVEDLHQKLSSFNPTLTTTANDFSHDQMTYSPSLFLTYKLNDQNSLKFIYSRKVQRPNGNQLNPLIVFSEDGLTARSGNSSLKPSQTDKYDFDIYHDTQLVNSYLQFYYNATTGTIEQVSNFLTSQPDVLLTTYENIGSTRNGGVSGNWSIHTADRAIMFSINPNYGYTVSNFIDRTTHLPVRQQGPNSNITSRFTYRPDTADTITAGLNYRGKTVRVESLTTPSSTMTLSWQHQIIQGKFILTANASNIQIGPISKNIGETSVSRTLSERYDQAPTFMLSLKYTFGQIINRQGNRNGGRRGDGQGGGRGGGGRGGGGGGGGFGGGGGGGGGFGGGGGGY